MQQTQTHSVAASPQGSIYGVKNSWFIIEHLDGCEWKFAKDQNNQLFHPGRFFMQEKSTEWVWAK